MKRLLISIVFLSFTLAFLQGHAQISPLDSLQKIVRLEKDDTNKVDHYIQIGQIYSRDNNKDSALIFYTKASDLAGKLNYKKGSAKTCIETGYVYEDQAYYSMALEYYLRALKVNQEIGDRHEISRSYLNIGNVYRDQSIYPKALENYLQSLKLEEELKDETGIGKCYVSIGNVYLGQLNYPKALDYYYRSMKIFEPRDNKNYLSLIYGNTGLVYERRANYAKALEFQLKALKIFDETNDGSGVARTCNNIGNIYSDQQNNEKALEYFTKGFKVAEENGDKATMADCLVNMGTAYNHKKEYTKAKDYLYKAKALQTEINDIDGLRITYEALSNSEKGSGDYKSAFEDHVKFKELTDSIFNLENTKQLSDYKTNFEVEKKEAELKAQQDKKEAVFKSEEAKKELEIRNQKIIRNVVIGGLFALLVLIFYVSQNLKQSKKVNEMLAQQKVEILNKNQDLHSKNNLIEYQKKEITDSIEYAKTIQHAMLPSEKEIRELFPESFVLFKPKDIVSGDFYWFRKSNDVHFVAAVDCTGHGVPGAFMSMIGNDKLNLALKEKKFTRPSDILGELNRGVKNALKQNDLTSKSRDGMDIALCAFDLKTKRLHYSGANRALYHISNGSFKEYSPTKSAIGGFTSESFEYALNTISYSEGDVFYLCTDGYADQFGGGKGKKLMTKNFKQFLLSISGKSMPEQQKMLDHSFEEWRGDFEQVDDVLVIGVRV